MKSFLCRVMTFVFLLNCLTPATGWGQTARRSNTKSRTLDSQVTQRVQKAQENNSPAAQFARADQNARAAHNARFAEADSIADQNRKAQLATQQDAFLIQQPSSLRVASRVAPQRTSLEATPAKKFLQKLANNEIGFEDLIEYADPMDPNPEANSLLTMAYAAEVISNTVSESMQLDPSLYDANELQAQLVQIQARLLYRMALLGFEMPSYTANTTSQNPVSVSRLALNEVPSLYKTMALASLRMALLKIHRFYQAKQLPDPADEYQKEMLVQKMLRAQRLVIPRPELNDGLSARFPAQPRQDSEQAKQQARQKAAKDVEKQGNLAVFMDQFVRELKGSLAQEPKQGTSDYQHAQVRAEYATAYALEYNPAVLKQIVALVDQGPKETDFKQDYSPILNAIFVTIFENTRYSTMGEAKTKQVLNLLLEFSDPQKYSLPTQVFALEAASLLYRPFNQDAFNLKKNNSPVAALFAPVNFNQPDETLRATFAQRVAQLYCPLISKNSSAMKSYGLDSSEMETLADKLAYMYDGFYDIHTAWFEDANAPAGQKVRANYPQTQCHITLHGNLNTLKKTNEQVAGFLYFTGEVLFWVYGGEVFSLLGTAFRLTRGAVAALPKAQKAFTLAARGEKVAAFNAQIQEGARFANWIKQQGYFVEALVQKAPARVETETVIENGVRRTIKREIPAVTEYKPINHTYQLEGKYSHWNPKRWLGMKPENEVVGYRVVRREPGFNTTVGEMRLGAPIDGLHNLQEVSQMTRQLQMTDGSRFWFEQQPYWRGMLNLAQVQQENWTLGGLQNAFKNQMDLWVPLEEIAQKTGQISETTRWWNVTQWGAPAKWGELVEGKMWGKAGVGGVTDLMPVYVAPRTAFQTLAQTPIGTPGLTSIPGVTNIADRLPGFYTSGADLASGNVYKQMFNAYMKPLNWQSTAAKTFLPDYLPTKAFWQSVRMNPVLGAQLVPQLLWRNRLASTTAFFGVLNAIDYGAYPAFESWLIGEQTKEVNAELSKYGDTFDPQRAKMDELLAQELGADLSDQRSMQTYQSVVESQKQERDGTSVVAPIIMARRAMGMKFVDEGTKQLLAQQAARMDLNHATLQRTHKIVEQNKKIEAQNVQIQESVRQQLLADAQQLLAQYRLGFAALPGSVEKLHRAYAQYTQQVLAARTEAEVETAKNQFDRSTQQLLIQVATYDEQLKEAEKIIQTSRKKYAQVPAYFTPQVEKQIRAVYKTYAQDLLNIDMTQPQEAQLQQALAAMQKLGESFKQVMDQMESDFYTKHPQYQAPQGQTQWPQYGAEFDPNAAQEE